MRRAVSATLARAGRRCACASRCCWACWLHAATVLLALPPSRQARTPDAGPAGQPRGRASRLPGRTTSVSAGSRPPRRPVPLTLWYPAAGEPRRGTPGAALRPTARRCSGTRTSVATRDLSRAGPRPEPRPTWRTDPTRWSSSHRGSPSARAATPGSPSTSPRTGSSWRPRSTRSPSTRRALWRATVGPAPGRRCDRSTSSRPPRSPRAVLPGARRPRPGRRGRAQLRRLHRPRRSRRTARHRGPAGRVRLRRRARAGAGVPVRRAAPAPGRARGSGPGLAAVPGRTGGRPGPTRGSTRPSPSPATR